ncbi:glycosyltransferase family 2 protein [Patescibacteria group bacterium]|nr:glycosyltransferase family 2 protein [Patescibacteria group bacterium]MBU1029226.1 glycosyltransferase family 2 protein [Patescibacteria group bacterium]MBU1915674.1 glycosyltransferase family 2 protein [Patescibacteria group bacterium]
MGKNDPQTLVCPDYVGPACRAKSSGRPAGDSIDGRSYRWAEIFPGAIVWTTLIAAVVLSRLAPLQVMYFIILFDLYWVLRVCYFVVLLLVSWRRYRQAIRTDWLALAKDQPGFADTYHLILLPTYKEGLEILRGTLNSLVASSYPVQEKMMVVLGGEEPDRKNFERIATQLQQEFAGRFFQLEFTVHPHNVPGDLVGKGSNVHFMGHRVKELVDSLGLRYDQVIVSSFDCDTVVHEHYFSCVTYKYLTHPTPTRASYQPVALFNNNAWEASPVVRVAISGTTFWLMSELIRPERMFTFSSHSMSMQALVDVGFWERDIVTEDSRIFLQCSLHYDGDYSVVPIYTPVSMDMVQAETHWRSLVNFYKQQRRWAYGVEHFPYLIRRFHENPRFPLRKKIFYLFTLVEGMYSWATAPLLIFLLGYLPLWLAAEPVRVNVFYQNTPHVLEALMRLAMVGVFVSAFIGLALLPPRPRSRGRWQILIMILQWVMVPVTFVLFGSIPAIDAQTRLMLGKYLGFEVTEKKRNNSDKTIERATVISG